MILITRTSRSLGDTWPPSEVRRRLVAARHGASPLLRELDGSDSRQARTVLVGKDTHFEVLMGAEAVAALDLLASLHRGDIDSFVILDGVTHRIDPRYWEPRHDAALVCVGDATRAVYAPPVLMPLDDEHTPYEIAAWTRRLEEETERAKKRHEEDLELERTLQRSPLIWHEDTISNHLDWPVPSEFVSLPVMILSEQAAPWIKKSKTSTTVDRRAKKSPDKDLLAKWVDDNIALPAREVRARKIRETWPGSEGTEPTQKVALAALEAVRGPSKGPGRPPKM